MNRLSVFVFLFVSIIAISCSEKSVTSDAQSQGVTNAEVTPINLIKVKDSYDNNLNGTRHEWIGKTIEVEFTAIYFDNKVDVKDGVKIQVIPAGYDVQQLQKAMIIQAFCNVNHANNKPLITGKSGKATGKMKGKISVIGPDDGHVKHPRIILNPCILVGDLVYENQ